MSTGSGFLLITVVKSIAYNFSIKLKRQCYRFHFIFIFFLGLPFSSKAQNNFTLKLMLLDINSYEPISYCTVYSTNSNKGTYSDKNGLFEIDVKQNDTLVLSHIAYQIKKVMVSDFIQKNTDTIFLSSQSIALKEIDIKPSEYENVHFKNKKKASFRFSGWPGHTIAFHLDRHQGGILQEVTFFLQNPPSNSTVFAALRLIEKKNTYSHSHQLLDTNLVYQIKKRKLKIDLRDYYIEIPESGILIGLEFLPNPSYQELGGKNRLRVDMTDYFSDVKTYISRWGEEWVKWSFQHEGKNLNLQVSYKILKAIKE